MAEFLRSTGEVPAEEYFGTAAFAGDGGVTGAAPASSSSALGFDASLPKDSKPSF